MKEYRIDVYCDRHQPENVPGTVTRQVALDGMKFKTLDLCEQCEKELFDEVSDLLVRFGVPLDTPVTAPKTRKTPPPARGLAGPEAVFVEPPVPASPDTDRTKAQCEICDSVVLRSSLISHLWSHSSIPRPPVPSVCPECGGRYDIPQSMTTHRRRMHGYDSVAESYTIVRANLTQETLS